MNNLIGDEKVELISWIPENMATDIYNFNDEHIIAMETSFENNTNHFHTWFNGEGYHAISTGVLYTDRTLIKSYFGDENITISASNFPLPATLAQSLQKNTSLTIQGTGINGKTFHPQTRLNSRLGRIQPQILLPRFIPFFKEVLFHLIWLLV